MQAAEGKFNPHIHVEYEWSLRLEEMDESDDDLDDKVRTDIHVLLLGLTKDDLARAEVVR